MEGAEAPSGSFSPQYPGSFNACLRPFRDRELITTRKFHTDEKFASCGLQHSLLGTRVSMPETAWTEGMTGPWPASPSPPPTALWTERVLMGQPRLDVQRVMSTRQVPRDHQH